MSKTKVNLNKVLFEISIIVLSGVIAAFALYSFTYTLDFAPSGFDGVATILQYKTGINAGIFTLIVSLPLLLIAFFILSRKYMIYTIIYTIISSVLIIILEKINFYQYVSETDKVIQVVFSGILLGIRTGLMFKIGGSSGGIDVIATLIQKKNPHKNIENIIFMLSFIIILVSFFIYNMELNSVLLSIIQMYVISKTINYIMKSSRNAVEFKIITKEPEEFREDIIKELKHGATITEAKGYFNNEDKKVLYCVINRRQIGAFQKIIKKHKNTFAYFSEVNGVIGNFRWNKDDIAN